MKKKKILSSEKDFANVLDRNQDNSVSDDAQKRSKGGLTARSLEHNKPKTIEIPQRDSPEIQADEKPPSKASKNFSRKTPISFPGSWRELVDIWMVQRPLEARMLEVCHLEYFGTDRIHLSVIEGSLASSRLLQPEVQKLLHTKLIEFGFLGRLVISPRPADEHVEETLLDQRQREKIENEAKLVEASKEDPLALVICEVFNAKIEHVELTKSLD